MSRFIGKNTDGHRQKQMATDEAAGEALETGRCEQPRRGDIL